MAHNVVRRGTWTAAVLFLVASRSHTVLSFTVTSPILSHTRAAVPLRRQPQYSSPQKLALRPRRLTDFALARRTFRMAATVDDTSADKVDPWASLPDELPMNVLACDGDLVTLKLGLEAVPSNILQGRAVKFDSGAQGVVVWQRLPLIFVLRCAPPSIFARLQLCAGLTRGLRGQRP